VGKRSIGGLLLAGSLLVAGCQAAAHPVALVSRGRSVVPWVDQVATSAAPKSAPQPTTKYPPCRAGQLSGHVSIGGGAGGTFYQSLWLANSSARACALAGIPTVIGIGPDARKYRFRPATGVGDNLIGPGPAELAPGERGGATLASWDGCPRLLRGRKEPIERLLVRLPRAGQLAVRVEPTDNAVCGFSVSRFGAAPPKTPSQRSPLNRLTASLQVPSTVQAGTVLTYTVTLRNTADRAISLSPCPSYTEYLYAAQPATVRHDYSLNCAGVHRIPALGSVQFAMRIPVPAGSGSAKMGWQLHNSEVATATIVNLGGCTTVSLQAAIAACHASAGSVAETDWREIARVVCASGGSHGLTGGATQPGGGSRDGRRHRLGPGDGR
jgi:hypothetical protein